MSSGTPSTGGGQRPAPRVPAASGDVDVRRRSLPTWLFIGGLMLLYVAERLISEGGMYWPTFGAAVLGIVAAVVLRAVALSRASGQTHKVILSTLAAYGGALLALLLYWIGRGAGEDSSLVLLQALWPAVMACSLFPLVAMEASFATMPLEQGVELRRVTQSAHTGLIMALGLTIAFAANYVAAKKEVRKDVSYFKTSMPGEGTGNLIANLTGSVEAVLFFPDANEVYEQAAPYFEALAAVSPNFTVRRTDHALDPELANEHKVPENGYVVLLFEGRAQKWKIGTKLETARRSLRRLDGDFQERFRKLISSSNIAYFTAGHNELDARRGEDRAPVDKVQVVRELLRRLNITVKPLGLAQGLAADVPDDAGVVIVMGPADDFLPEEKDALVRYVERGGRIMLLLDPDSDADLSPVLSHLGVSLKSEVLVSDTSFVRASGTDADKEALATRSFSSHPAVTTVSRNVGVGWGLAFNRVGYLEKAADATSAANKVTFIVRSMPATWNDLDGDRVHDAASEKKMVYQLAAAITVPPTAEGIESRAVVVADSHFTTDRFMLGSKGNQAFFVDAVLWLMGEESISAGPPASEEDIRIVHTRDQDVVWFYGTVFGVPGLVFLGGIWFTRRRRRRTP